MSKNATAKSKWIDSSLALVRAACAEEATDDDKRHGAAACRALLEAIAGVELAPPAPIVSKATAEIPAAAELVTPPPPPPVTPPPAPPTKPADFITALIDRYAHLVPPEERPRPLSIPMAPIPRLPAT